MVKPIRSHQRRISINHLDYRKSSPRFLIME
jgi:hypothetical protein